MLTANNLASQVISSTRNKFHYIKLSYI